MLLPWLSLPAALGLMVALNSSAIAAPTNRSASLKPDILTTTGLSCGPAVSADQAKSIDVSLAGTADEGWIDFTAAESDGAVLLFGCDCSSCINALQQLRRNNLLDAIGGHCAANFARNSSETQVDDVLAAITVAEAQGPDTNLIEVAESTAVPAPAPIKFD